MKKIVGVIAVSTMAFTTMLGLSGCAPSPFGGPAGGGAGGGNQAPAANQTYDPTGPNLQSADNDLWSKMAQDDGFGMTIDYAGVALAQATNTPVPPLLVDYGTPPGSNMTPNPDPMSADNPLVVAVQTQLTAARQLYSYIQLVTDGSRTTVGSTLEVFVSGKLWTAPVAPGSPSANQTPGQPAPGQAYLPFPSMDNNRQWAISDLNPDDVTGLVITEAEAQRLYYASQQSDGALTSAYQALSQAN